MLPHYTLETLEETGIMTLTDSNIFFVHVTHPALPVLQALYPDDKRELVVDEVWIRTSPEKIKEAASVIRECGGVNRDTILVAKATHLLKEAKVEGVKVVPVDRSQSGGSPELTPARPAV